LHFEPWRLRCGHRRHLHRQAERRRHDRPGRPYRDHLEPHHG